MRRDAWLHQSLHLNYPCNQISENNARASAVLIVFIRFLLSWFLLFGINMHMHHDIIVIFFSASFFTKQVRDAI